MHPKTDNLEYLAALLHGRRSRMAEGVRLRALCQARTLPDFAREVLGGTEVPSAIEIQRAVVRALVEEGLHLVSHLSGVAGELLELLVARFQVEDLKLLIRGLMTEAPAGEMRAHLMAADITPKLDLVALSKAKSVATLVELMPKGRWRRDLAWALELYHKQPRSFFFEAALDRGYFCELLVSAQKLSVEDREQVKPFLLQEADILHLMLVTRGKFAYGLEAESLLPLHVPGTRISSGALTAMIGADSVGAVTSLALGRVVDVVPGALRQGKIQGESVDPGAWERLAWSRFWRLANQAFRVSHMGVAMVFAYVELRRVEVANLITICEGIRAGVAAESIWARLIPIAEATHV